MRALIVDDHPLIAQSVTMALEAEGALVEVFSGATPDLLVATAAHFRPDVILLDLHLGGALGSGLDLIAPLTATGASVLVLTGVTDRPTLAACIEAGASGVASKGDPLETLVADVLAVAAAQPVMDEKERHALLDELRAWRAAERERHAPFAELTAREGDVLADLMRGKPAETIAREHFVALATIRSQIHSTLRKLGVNSQLAAVARAREAGWAPAKVAATSCIPGRGGDGTSGTPRDPHRPTSRRST